MKKNYTGIFFDDGTHMTWNYGSPLKYPVGVKAGDKMTVEIYGKYQDADVGCWVVKFAKFAKFGIYENQPNGTLLHITFKALNGTKPVESGKRATSKGFKKLANVRFKTGTWK